MGWILLNLITGYVIKFFGEKGWVNHLNYIAWGLAGFQGLKLFISFLYLFRIGIFKAYNSWQKSQKVKRLKTVNYDEEDLRPNNLQYNRNKLSVDQSAADRPPRISVLDGKKYDQVDDDEKNSPKKRGQGLGPFDGLPDNEDNLATSPDFKRKDQRK